ncbi:MAG: oxygen-dependent coproporphyrinogen oxidase [Bacteroidetes bacterium]|nr:oxygen-dependent coproporphyrinogen oxidase [Bacteroidota bacterium]MBS1974496.1 oxygen-dependent coproporphyrinogen oxidase [Bacteroidota bacterium]
MTHKTETKEFRGKWIDFIHKLQDKICRALEDIDGKAKFSAEEWVRNPDGKGGGGITKVIQHGYVFEKGGVNTSVVYGKLSRKMREVLHIPLSSPEATWFAAGISSVIHPLNPFVPTIHFNYRMFELYDKDGRLCDRWFGGGTDLTPYYLFDEDAVHFHSILKKACDKFDEKLYPLFKHNCDEYFVNTHRNNERRGIGGIFYDHKKEDGDHDADFWFGLAQACGKAFIDAYVPVVEKRKNISFTNDNKYWQEIRRGRYVEFNLVHDRGTLFGLKTNGRTESVLMSLPPTVRFEYNHQPQKGMPEADLLNVCLNPRDWV